MATETPLLQSFELEIQTEQDITNELVKENHNVLVNNGLHIEYKTNELIEIFGGVDNILKFYLSHNDSLNKSQLTQINDIIVSTTLDNQNNNINTKLTDYNTQLQIIEVSRSDTFYHLIMNKSIANTIINFLLSKVTAVCAGILLMCSVITHIIGVSTDPTYQWPMAVLFALLMILLLLSVNRLLCIRTIFTFDFFVKMIYAIRLFLCKTIPPHHRSTDIPEHIGDTNYILLVATISFLDGLQMNIKVKIILVGLVSVLYSLHAIDYTFFHDPYTYNLFGEWNLDITALEAGSYRVIALFAWVQTYRLVVGSNMSTMIAKPLKIQWID
eukprot:529882_1